MKKRPNKKTNIVLCTMVEILSEPQRGYKTVLIFPDNEI